MKKIIYLSSPFSVYTIFICLMTLLVFHSCDQSEHQLKVPLDTTQQITNRTIEDCGDCPIGYCCCAIELLDGDIADLLFCGVYTAMIGTTCGPFTPPGNCPTVSGISSTISLGDMNPTRGLFCVGTGGAFRLEYLGVESVLIRISCQYNDVTPDWEYITLDEDDVLYFDSNGGCFLMECN